MKDELIVESNGVYHPLDLGASADVTLKYNSNIFTDISKIVSNNSYTIKAPLTSKNRNVLDSAEMPMYESNFIHKKHTAQYFRNGLQIIKNAQIVLLSSTDAYELALTWGNISRFADMVNRGETLNELSGNDFIVWNQQFSGMDHGDFFIPFIYYGIETSPGVGDLNKNIFQHPVVKVSWILEKIQSDNNIILLFPDDKKEFINRLIVPLLSKNGGKPNRIESVNDYEIKGTYNNKYYAFPNYWGDIALKYFSPYFVLTGGINPIGFIPRFTGKVKIETNFRSSNGNIVVILKNADQGEKIYNLDSENTGYANYPYLYKTSIEIDVKAGDAIHIGANTGNIDYEKGGVVKVSLIPKEIITGIAYPVIANLPKIKQIDFIKAICNILGLFAIPVEGSTNTIKLVTLDAIYDNKPKAYDWTKKIIRTQISNKPKEIKYSLPDFARTNWFRYKKDDTVKGDYDGAINVYNDSLDKEKDMVTLPFAASDSERHNGIAIVPLYSYKEDTDNKFELEYSECEPRILLESNDGSLPIGVFAGLNFNTLIDTNYSKYREVVAKPKIIKEKVYLTNYELMSLDLTIPVYFYQHARYYAIISIQANKNNICECELLQL
nr:MAG TPA: hypothetical protein [Caudoviricetes sp.]